MQLTATQRAIRETVREVAREEIRPTAGECDREGRFPEDAWDALADIDVTGLTVPEAYGGLDVDRATYAVVNEAVAYGSLAVATALSVHCLATSCIATFGDESVREAWLPDMVDGRPVGAFALSEPDAGSNPRQMRTVARRDGDEYVIDGEKLWITNGERSGVVIVFAKTDADDPNSVTQFLVPKDADGVAAGPPMDKLGLRASDTTALTLDEVRVPARYRLTEPGRGLAAAFEILTGGRVGIAAQSVGLSTAAFDQAVAYVQEREQFDAPLAEIQSVRHTIAEMYAKIQASRELTHAAARAMDRGEDARTGASVAKYVASEAAVEVTERALQLHGGYGYTTDFDVERFYRDAKVTTIYEGTSEIQKNVIARDVLD